MVHLVQNGGRTNMWDMSYTATGSEPMEKKKKKITNITATGY